MPITERGRWASSTLDEWGKRIVVNLTEQGQLVIGVSSGTPSTPSVTVTSISKQKISDEVGMNASVIKFTFDTDVTAWKVNVMGVSYDTGTVADSGGAVTAGAEVTAVVSWDELYQEGDNRVNIYGQTAGGWTPYGN
jgi:hypothetical protein